ncbi:hypothetical protein GIB67_038313 [Kingdonia uniflora]|uniref:Retinoblastoma-related protein n=1 Tax=Kingdonia uniflora TaxID=39325 RepID=A0A7J7KUM8_9MAGN|nr:hypothetical protein GIB67_038313 [Kingdonia uniflora]
MQNCELGLKMEPSTPTFASESDQGVALEARFVEICRNDLSITKETFSQAIKLLREAKTLLQANLSAISSGTPEDIERIWFAFILYSIKRLAGNCENGFTFRQILTATKINIIDFFKEMPQFCLKVGPILSHLYGADWEKRLEAKELQANYVHLRLLSNHYKNAYQEFFSANDRNGDKSTDNRMTGHPSDYHRFGWLLFLALRVHAFSRFKDLVTCTTGLVAVLAILILHVPIHFRKLSINESPRFVRNNNKEVDILSSLCNIFHTSEDEVRRTMEKANNLIVDILMKKPRMASECKNEILDNIDTGGLFYFEDLMEESSLSTSLVLLEKDYDDAIYNKGELDERAFVNDEDSLSGTGSLSGGGIAICGTKRKFDVMSPVKTVVSQFSPLRSPANSKIAATPISTAMTTAKWLRTVISPLPSKPSTTLERFLESCDKDVTHDVLHRAHIILEAIFPSSVCGERSVCRIFQSVNMMDNLWVEERRLEALKLYYRVLEAMCTAEAQILHTNNLTSLLTNDRFHRCMLACSAELVLATHKTTTVFFPAVLERTGITAFDLSKVIESFIRHDGSLPRELRRHLNSLEERLLESMVWEKGSSMYNSLIIAKPDLCADISHLGLLAEPMPSLDMIAMLHSISLPFLHNNETSPDQNGDIRSPKRVCTGNRIGSEERNFFSSPEKDGLLAHKSPKLKLAPPLQSAFASPTRLVGGGETSAETGINVFLSKIIKLAAVRINGLVETVQLSQEVRDKVYCLFQQVLRQRTSLFFNRHIDQNILCSLYGVSKISKLNLTFKEIIHHYRKQPHCKPQVFRSVFVDWSLTPRRSKSGQEHVDIIVYYNEFFIPSVKPLLVDLGSVVTIVNTKQSPEIKNMSDGQIPGSPRLNPFPGMPDMSPKKVSAERNIYISPLRSPKMDALTLHSSKSYYACVGESTRAYQSPSKDLKEINTRLSSKKVSSKLNFDNVGLVSDSLVMGSLDVQNSSCPSSSIPAQTTAVKTEELAQVLTPNPA